MKIRNIILALGTVIAASASSASAVSTFTETFNTGTSNWLNNAPTPSAATWSSSGGILDSGYISYTQTFTSASEGSFGAPPLQLFFRGNNAANASDDAFVGNWLDINARVTFLTLSIRHDYSTSLGFYSRIAGSGGAGASSGDFYTIAPNTWTTITIPITNTNPPFISFGSSSYNGVFSNVQNLQFGLYVPASSTFTNLKMDIDDVKITVVPEPHEYALAMAGLLAIVIIARRRQAAAV